MVASTNRNENIKTGLVSYVFESQDGSDRIYAFRGSEGSVESGNIDWKDNFGLADKGESPQNRAAIDFVKQIEMSRGLAQRNHATGHSLGGSNAMAVAGVYGMKGAGFNSRGVAPAVVKEYDDFKTNFRNSGFQAVRTEGDIVSSLDDFAWQPENVRTVPGVGFLDEKNRYIEAVPTEMVHKINSFYQDLELIAHKNPIIRNLVTDTFVNGLWSKINTENVDNILKMLGCVGFGVIAGVTILTTPALLSQVLTFFAKHSDAIDYLFQFQHSEDGNKSQPNIFAPHYSQSIFGNYYSGSYSDCAFQINFKIYESIIPEMLAATEQYEHILWKIQSIMKLMTNEDRIICKCKAMIKRLLVTSNQTNEKLRVQMKIASNVLSLYEEVETKAINIFSEKEN